MLNSLFSIIQDIIGPVQYELWMEMFGLEPDTFRLIFMTCCILICITVSFVFKFLLKLVDR